MSRKGPFPSLPLSLSLFSSIFQRQVDEEACVMMEEQDVEGISSVWWIWVIVPSVYLPYR